jgi:tetratricopeptide (TPR) repeat protein
MKTPSVYRKISLTVLAVFIFLFIYVTDGSPLSPPKDTRAIFQSETETQTQKLLAKANDFFAEGDYDEADKYYTAVMHLNPQHKGARYRKAVCRQYLDDYDAALHILEELMLQYPEDIFIKKQWDEVQGWKREQLMTKANTLFFKDLYEDAERFYDQVLDINPKDRDALFKKAVIRQYEADYDTALEQLLYLNDEYPNQLHVQNQIWEVLKWQVSGTNSDCEKYLESDAGNQGSVNSRNSWDSGQKRSYALFKTGICLKNQGRFDDALKKLYTLLGKFPENMVILGEIAETLAWHEAYSHSIQIYQTMLEIDDNIPLRLKYAEILAWDGRYEDAKSEYRDILSIEPDQFHAKLGLAEVFAFENNYRESLHIYKEITEDLEDSYDLLYGLARLYMWMDRLDTARKRYEWLETAYPDDVFTKLDLQRINYWQGLNKLALHNIKDILEKHPNQTLAMKLQTEILNNSRRFYESRGETFDDSGENQFFRLTQELNFRTDMQNRLWFQWDFWRTDDVLNQRTHANVYGMHHLQRWSRSAATKVGFSLVQLSSREENDHSAWEGDVRLIYNPIHMFRIDLGLGREYILETSELIEKSVYFDTADLDFEFKITPKSAAFLGVSLSKVSDDNERRTLFAGGLFHLTPYTDIIYRFRYMGYQRDLNNGYFNPQHYISHEGRFVFHRDWDKIKVEIQIGMGLEGINHNAFSLTGMFSALIQYEINNDWIAEGHFGLSNSSIDSVSGYSWRKFNVRIRYRF